MILAARIAAGNKSVAQAGHSFVAYLGPYFQLKATVAVRKYSTMEWLFVVETRETTERVEVAQNIRWKWHTDSDFASQHWAGSDDYIVVGFAEEIHWMMKMTVESEGCLKRVRRTQVRNHLETALAEEISEH